jgi:AraC-like DNA-binding protein
MQEAARLEEKRRRYEGEALYYERENALLEVADNMYSEGYSLEEISKITKLSERELKEHFAKATPLKAQTPGDTARA